MTTRTDTERKLRDRLLALLGPSHPHDEGVECGTCAAYNLLLATPPDTDPSGLDAYNARMMEAWAALTDEERFAAHQDDSYGGCVICLEYIPHTDDESVKVAFPCAVVQLAAIQESRAGGGLDARAELAVKMADRMAQAYRSERFAVVAEVCDETLDESGNLLGWLRDYVAAYAKDTDR